MELGGRCRVGRLTIGGEVAAMLLGVVVDDRLWVLKLARNERFDECSPGNLLIREVVSGAAKEGLVALEHGGIQERWTVAWSNRAREHVEICVYPFSGSGIAALASDGGRAVKARALRWRPVGAGGEARTSE